MTYAERVAADRRLIVLRTLVDNEGAASEAVLERALLDLGERKELDREAVRQLIRDLQERDCLKYSLYLDKVMVAEITKRGAAVVERRIKVEGVAQPSIGC